MVEVVEALRAGDMAGAQLLELVRRVDREVDGCDFVVNDPVFTGLHSKVLALVLRPHVAASEELLAPQTNCQCIIFIQLKF